MRVLAQLEYQRFRPIGIGQGMNSEVYFAHDPQLGGDIAIKEIEKSRFGNDIDAYFGEAQTMFAVNHPNIVPVQYACATGEKICLAMPYFERGSLTDRIEVGPIPASEVLRIGQAVLAGLARIHAARFIHFDIKPSNVLFDDRDKPMLADFGQTRRISTTGVVRVPPMYSFVVPPETWISQVGTLQSDIYQVGLLLYRASNGDPMYRDQIRGISDAQLKEKVTKGRLPDRQLFMPHLPRRLRTIIRKALAVDPRDRFHSATEMADVLGRVRLSLNWVTAINSVNETTWRATRPGKTDLEVRLLCTATGNWDVQCWTVNGSERRAKGVGSYSRGNLGLREANKHLTAVFADLTS